MVSVCRIFAECRAVIPPEPFFKGCVFDGCRIADEYMQCSSLEMYATECAARGVCIDWRGKTNNTCRKYSRTQKCVLEMVAINVLFSKHILHLTLDYCLQICSDVLTHRSCRWRRQSCSHFCCKKCIYCQFLIFFLLFPYSIQLYRKHSIQAMWAH